MKNELSRRGNYSDYDFFEDAMRDFFPAFYGRRGEGHKYMILPSPRARAIKRRTSIIISAANAVFPAAAVTTWAM